MSKKVAEQPFHLSVVDYLKNAESKISQNFAKVFIPGFVSDVKIVASLISITKVPEEAIPNLIDGLEEIYKNFETKYPRYEDRNGSKHERNSIERYFKEVVSDLQKRLPAEKVA